MTYYLSSAYGDEKFDSKEELKEHIKAGFNRSGSWDWIDDIYDDEGNRYECEWNLEIVKIHSPHRD